MTISTTRIRNADGTWAGWTTVIDEPAPVTNPTSYTVVDRTDRTVMADWRSGVAPVAEDADECDECPPGRPCWCTASSTDPLDY